MGNITPAKRALAALDASPSDVAEAPKRISKKIRAAIDAMVGARRRHKGQAARQPERARPRFAPARSSSAWQVSPRRQHERPRARDWSAACKSSSSIMGFALLPELLPELAEAVRAERSRVSTKVQ